MDILVAEVKSTLACVCDRSANREQVLEIIFSANDAPSHQLSNAHRLEDIALAGLFIALHFVFSGAQEGV